MKQTFWQKNHVFIMGCITALLTALAPLVLNTTLPEWQAIIIAASIGVGSYVGNESRGKGWTIGTQISSGLLGLAAGMQQGSLEIWQLGFFVLLAFIGIPIPGQKPATYEKTPTIQQAKDEAAFIKSTEKEEAVG
jgi:hypothetical protein